MLNVPRQAETMLREDPSLAQCACSETGEIPYHAAMATGLLPLVKLMKQLLNESAVEEKEPAHDALSGPSGHLLESAELKCDEEHERESGLIEGEDSDEIIVFQSKGITHSLHSGYYRKGD